jgi:nucleotidyltransferase substrate binding protein (TIGR01987 family)
MEPFQRFEFTFELFWKTIQRLLAREGVEARSPKAALREAYRLGWLDDEARWIKLLEDRNLTSHTYRELLALEIYSRTPAHYAAMREAFEKLRPPPTRLTASLHRADDLLGHLLGIADGHHVLCL